jgi:hypothetical protein
MQISPASVRGTYGSLLQIASCVGILAALVAGLPAHSVPGWYVVEIPSCRRDVCATFAYIHYFLFFHCVVVKIVILGIGTWVLLVSTACFHIIGMQKNSGGFWNRAVELRLANFVSRWRACFWISTVPACLLALGMEFCAESPRWLFKQSEWYEAEQELERLWGPSHVKGAMADLVRAEQSHDSGGTSWHALINPRYIKVVAIGAALFAFQQFAGINAVFYFSSTVFQAAGVTSDVAASVSVGAVNLLGM